MASTSLFLVLTALMLVVTVQAQNKYAERVKACYDKERNNSDTCLKDLWHELRPILAAGDPTANIKPFDPMKMDDMNIEQQGAVLQGKVLVTNITAIGGSNYNIKSVTYNRANKTVTTNMEIPYLNITGKHAIEATILLLPINGKGPFSINLTRIEATTIVKLIRKGALMAIDKLDLLFKAHGIKIGIEGLIGDDTVGTAVKNMLNDNGQAMLDDIRPQVSSAISNGIKSSFEALLLQLPD